MPQVKADKIDTALELKAGTADRALGEVMRELPQIALGGSFQHMQRLIETHFPTSPQEIGRFVDALERLRRACEGAYQIAIGEQNIRRSKG